MRCLSKCRVGLAVVLVGLLASVSQAQYVPPSLPAVEEAIDYASIGTEVLTIGALAMLTGFGVYIAFKLAGGLLRFVTRGARA